MPRSARLRSFPLAGPTGPLELVCVATSASEPKQLVLLAGADHFFAGQLEPMQQALFGWLKEQLP
jgi:alpha/beta superfamily hydrolase